jgi:thioredoxin 1
MVEFYSILCPHCHTAELKVDQLAGEYAGRVRFYRIENGAADRAGLSNRYGISAVPTFIVFVKGQESGRIVGDKSIQEFRDMLNRALGE